MMLLLGRHRFMEGEAWDHWSVGLSSGLCITWVPFCFCSALLPDSCQFSTLPCSAYSMMDEPSETMRKEALL